MKKLILIGFLAGFWAISTQPAWASHRDSKSDEYKVFRKVVRVLDDVVNDDYGHKHRKYARHKGYEKVCVFNRQGSYCYYKTHYPRRHFGRHDHDDKYCRR